MIKEFKGIKPQLEENIFIAKSAEVIGKVKIKRK